MRQRVVVRLVVDVPDETVGRGGRTDAETAARRYITEVMSRLPAGLVADYEVIRVERVQPGKALWSE